jgi:hypothetical protein
MRGEGLVSFPVCVKETDLSISVDEASYNRSLPEKALEQVRRCREELDGYIALDPQFLHTLQPHPVPLGAPRIVRMMAGAAARAGVGPMAAVAGAFAELVGRSLLGQAREVIVENGGDVFLKTLRPRRAAIFAGPSPLSERVGLLIRPRPTAPRRAVPRPSAEWAPGGRGWAPRRGWAPGGCRGICTSSGTVGPSLSFGRADAAVVLGGSAALADAVATALGNRVQDESSIVPALQFACGIRGVHGAVVILGDKLGAMGAVELVPIG